MAEWLKAHAWKACLGETLTRVRIPLSPPYLRMSDPETWVTEGSGDMVAGKYGTRGTGRSTLEICPSMVQCRRFLFHVGTIFFVFAVGLDQVGIGEQMDGHCRTPGLGVGLRIVDGDFDFQAPEIAAREALRHTPGLGLR